MYQAIAAKTPGVITKIGLNTFVDPRLEGGLLNKRTTEPLVRLIEIDDEEWLFYPRHHLDVCFIRGTTADVYFSKNHPEISLIKYDQIADAFQALRDGRGAALTQDNTLVLAWALENKGYKVGIGTLGGVDPIAPAVQKGNVELRDWINQTFEKLGKERFALKAFNETLKPYYGDFVKPEDLIVEGGKFNR
jgi:hypothetical protein